MERLPHTYTLSLEWTHDRTGRLALERRPAIDVAPPPEFDGPTDRWSPEHLLVASVASCVLTTFLTFAAKENLVPRGYRTEARGRLEKTAKGLAFTAFELTVSVDVGAGDGPRTEQLLHRAEKGCLVSNSLAAPVTLDVHVREV